MKKAPPKNVHLNIQQPTATKSLTNAGTPSRDKRNNLLTPNPKPVGLLTPDRSRQLESAGGGDRPRNLSHSPSATKHDWGNTDILPKPSKHQKEVIKPLSSAVWTIDGKHIEGMWQQYEGIWFDMHSHQMGPILGDFPTPKVRSASSNPTSLTKVNFTAATKKTPITAKWKKPKFLGNDDDDDDLVLCLKCKVKKRKGIYLGCMHFFCKDCLYTLFKKHLDEKKVPVRCMAANCKYEIERNELVKIAHNSEEIKAFYDMNVTKFVEKRPHMLLQCYSPGCGYVADIGKAKDKNRLDCPRCKKSYCISCHQIAHPGECEEAKNAR